MGNAQIHSVIQENYNRDIRKKVSVSVHFGHSGQTDVHSDRKVNQANSLEVSDLGFIVECNGAL